MLSLALALLVTGGVAAQNPPAPPKPAPKPAAGMATHTPSHRVREARPGYLKQAKIPADSAERTALGGMSGGTVTSRMIEKQKGTLVYVFHIKSTGQSGYQLVTVDANTGAVVANTHVAAPAAKKPADTTKKKPPQQ